MTGPHPADESSRHEPRQVPYGESRWPMAAAVIAAAVLTLLLPDDLRLGPRWALPAVEGLLLVALIAGDPGRISRRSAALRAISIALVSVLACGAIWSTVRLTDDLVHGGSETNSADALLQAGGSVWATTVLAFSLLYFEIDSGGAAARAHYVPSALPWRGHGTFPEAASPQRDAHQVRFAGRPVSQIAGVSEAATSLEALD
ncbi:hypothetical protein ABT133_09410 [Streptomyces sp. NPDC001835]|uniref:hypothetical protein n=1 Tax=Streptomyces sp. NPDC001835 TaxID=3154528 RepID=UPI0033333D30